MSTQREGVIKFEAVHVTCPLPERTHTIVATLDPWRHILMCAGLLGCDPLRYEGLGFGNISHRLSPAEGVQFVVSGSQTGLLEEVTAQHYALIESYDLAQNRVKSCGDVMPSSETMTHAMLYELDPEIACVLHVHAPVLWRLRERLGLPTTAADIAYGTIEMAQAVESLYRRGGAADAQILAMAGHEDGIVAWGRSAEEAGFVLLEQHDAARKRV